MFVRYGHRSGEVSKPMVAKRCLTHNVECHKEGFEIGNLLVALIHVRNIVLIVVKKLNKGEQKY